MLQNTSAYSVHQGVRLLGSHCRRIDPAAGMIVQAASDWSIVIISTLPPSLTRSRGECLRVVGIHSDGFIEREISIVYNPF